MTAQILSYAKPADRTAKARRAKARKRAWSEFWNLVFAIVTADFLVRGIVACLSSIGR